MSSLELFCQSVVPSYTLPIREPPYTKRKITQDISLQDEIENGDLIESIVNLRLELQTTTQVLVMLVESFSML